jgi:hypothetical protein
LVRRETGWYYNRATWRTGPPFVGGPDYPPNPSGLLHLIRHRIYPTTIEWPGSWPVWLAAHPLAEPTFDAGFGWGPPIGTLPPPDPEDEHDAMINRAAAWVNSEIQDRQS